MSGGDDNFPMNEEDEAYVTNYFQDFVEHVLAPYLSEDKVI